MIEAFFVQDRGRGDMENLVEAVDERVRYRLRSATTVLSKAGLPGL